MGIDRSIRTTASVAACATLVLLAGARLPAGAAGTIQGYVRYTNAAPIASIWVDAYGTNNNYVDSGFTDTNGNYAITGLVAKTYYVRTYVLLGNYNDEWYDNIPAPDFTIPADATAVAVSNGVTAGIDFVLAEPPASGSISGRVTTAALQPLGGVWVDAYSADGTRQKSALTASNGTYLIQSAPEGLLYVRTDAIGLNYADEWYDDIRVVGATIPFNARAVSVVAGTVTGGVDFALSAGATIAGTVRGGVTPLSNVWVDVYRDTGDWLDSAATASNGTYQVSGLPPGLCYARTYVASLNYADQWYRGVPVVGYDIPANASGMVVAVGTVLPNVDFWLTSGATISGVVTDFAGTAIAGAAVDVYSSGGTWVKNRQTGGTGAYTVAGLAAGSFYVRTSAAQMNYVDEWYNDVPVVGTTPSSAAIPLVLSNGASATGIDFGLQPGGRIAGRVTDTNGAVLAGIGISAYDAGGNWSQNASTATNGTYEVRGLLAPGPFYAVTESGSRNYADQWYAATPVIGAGIPSNALAIPVIAGVLTNGIDFALAVGGVISGRVTDAQATNLAGVSVGVYSTAAKRAGGAQTDANGRYAVNGLPAGSMAVRTEIYTLNYADEWYNGITASGYTLPTQATIIAVSPGSLRTGVNFSLQKGGGISGNVTAAGGTPIVGEEIDVYDSGTNWIRGTETGAGGTYQAIGLATQGLYYVRTSVGSGNFINEWFDDMPLAGSGIPPGATGVRVPSGSVTGGVDFVLQRGGTLFGRVSDGADSPLTGIGLALYTTAGVWRASAETGVGGYYQMSQITPDTYYLRSDSGGLGFVDKWYQAASIDGSAIPIDAQPLALTANGTNQADLTLGFMIVSAGKAPDEEFSVRWQAASGTVYQVEWTTDFTVWTNAPAGSNDVQQSLRTAPAQSVLEYSVPTSTNMAGNYRVQIVH